MTNETKIPECSQPGGHVWINLADFGRMVGFRCKHCYLEKGKLPKGEKVGIL